MPFDLAAGDGRAGDDDRIDRDVESVIGSNFAESLTGSHHTLKLFGLEGDVVITGGTGAELRSEEGGRDPGDRPASSAPPWSPLSG